MNEEILKEAMDCYEKEENKEIMVAAAEIEFDNYGKYTRLEETLAFAKRIGAKAAIFRSTYQTARQEFQVTKDISTASSSCSSSVPRTPVSPVISGPRGFLTALIAFACRLPMAPATKQLLKKYLHINI